MTKVAGELGVDPGFGVFAELARTSAPSRIWTYRCRDGSTRSVRLAVTELLDREGRGPRLPRRGHRRHRRHPGADPADPERGPVARPDGPPAGHDGGDAGRDRGPSGVVAGAGAMRQGLGDAVGKQLSAVSKPENVVVIEALLQQALAGRRGRRRGGRHEDRGRARAGDDAAAGRRRRTQGAAAGPRREPGTRAPRAGGAASPGPGRAALRRRPPRRGGPPTSRVGCCRSTTPSRRWPAQDARDLVGRPLAALSVAGDHSLETHLAAAVSLAGGGE